tara:strand:- start:16 stop:423 length:408 start_codon:yes stop_codon:yes gene_type:complete
MFILEINDAGKACKFGINFEHKESHSTPVLHELKFEDNNETVKWVRLYELTSVSPISSEDEQRELAMKTLRSFLKIHKPRRRKHIFKAGDAVWHPKLRLNGVVLAVQDDIATVEINGSTRLQIPTKDIIPDRNAK